MSERTFSPRHDLKLRTLKKRDERFSRAMVTAEKRALGLHDRAWLVANGHPGHWHETTWYTLRKHFWDRFPERVPRSYASELLARSQREYGKRWYSAFIISRSRSSSCATRSIASSCVKFKVGA